MTPLLSFSPHKAHLEFWEAAAFSRLHKSVKSSLDVIPVVGPLGVQLAGVPAI